MKQILISTLMLLTLSVALQAQKNESVYTGLGEKDCRELPINKGDGILYRAECPGVGGYKLIFLEGDLRQSLNVVAPDGQVFELGLWQKVTAPKYSFLGEKAEWRVMRRAGKFVPYALIVRFNAYDSAAKIKEAESFLTVVKLAPQKSCLTDIVEPDFPNQNAQARRLADKAQKKPCRANFGATRTGLKNEEFPQVTDFLEQVLTVEDDLDSEALGDLNGDRLPDWVGVIRRSRSEVRETGPSFSFRTAQLVVLLRTEKGFRVAEESKEEAFGGLGCCWVESLEIKRGSFFIRLFAKTAGTVERATHQFRFDENGWRLIGLHIFYLEIENDLSTETDYNFLTGAVIEKQQKGRRKPIVKRSPKKFDKYFLKDYDFYNGFGLGEN